MASHIGSAVIVDLWPEWAIRVHSAQGMPAGRAASTAGSDERELVEACQAGSPGAFDTIVERHRREIYQLCYRFAGNHEDASDLSQEVFLRAYRGLHRFRGASSLRTWLYRVGVNVCLNHVGVKRPATEPIDAARHPDRQAEDPAASLIRAEQGTRVRAALAQLPRKQRAALILRVYHDLSHREVASVLGSSEGAVKANFFHGLRNLKKLLVGRRTGL
jgi:RNA polymerase sigma-70 factor, ECF subfamily